MKSLTNLIWSNEDGTKTINITKPAGLLPPPLKDVCLVLFCTPVGGGGNTGTAGSALACEKDAPARTLACIK